MNQTLLYALEYKNRPNSALVLMELRVVRKGFLTPEEETLELFIDICPVPGPYVFVKLCKS